MGWFFKDRHGTMHTVIKGRKFIWEIPDIKSYRDTVLDGHNVPSFDDVQFHFHMTVNPKGQMGFYLHYKGPPIPKYSYYFAAKDTTPPPAKASWFPPHGTSMTRVSRQFTAHTIPPDTERCGHWNVFNPEQLDALLEGTCGTLMVVFQFDDDTMAVESAGGGDLKYRWTIPRFRDTLCSPFTSRGITCNNQLFVLRMDRKGADGDYFCFVFSRSVKHPPMAMRVLAGAGEYVVAKIDRPSDDEMQMAPATMPREVIMGYVKPGDKLVVELTIFKVGNPLDQLNIAGAKFESVLSPPRAGREDAPETAQVGKAQYVVVADDL